MSLGGPVGLRCNYLVEPLAVRDSTPRLSWSLPEAFGPDPPRSHQVVVTADGSVPPAEPGIVWDTGRREGGGAREVVFAGPPLRPRHRYMWKVRVWTGAGTPSAWSDTASFETGIGGTAAWTAAWISWDPAAVPFEPATEPGPVDQVALGLTPAPYLRRDFDVPPGLACARLYITARGSTKPTSTERGWVTGFSARVGPTTPYGCSTRPMT